MGPSNHWNPPQQQKTSVSDKRRHLVEDQPGLLISASLLCLALFIGLAFRFVFSPGAIESRIKTELAPILQSKEFKLEAVQLSLAKGGIPQVALQIGEIQIEMAKHCQPKIKASLKAANFPISFWDFLFGDLRLNQIDIGQLDMHVEKGACFSKTKQNESFGLALLTKDESEKAQEQKNDSKRNVISEASSGTFSALRLPASSKDTFGENFQKSMQAWVKGLDVQFLQIQAKDFFRQTRLVLDRIKDSPIQFNRLLVQNYSMEFEGLMWKGSQLSVTDPLSVDNVVNYSGFFEFPQQLARNLSKYFKFRLNGLVSRDRVTSELSLLVNEGAAAIRLEMVDSESQGVNLNSKLNIEHFPVSSLAQVIEALHPGVIAKRPGFSWLDCRINSKSSIEALKTLRMVLERCHFSGRRGEIRAPMVQWTIGDGFEPFTVAVDKLDLSEVMAWFGLNSWRGIFDQLGRLSGEIQFKKDANIMFEGVLKDLNIRFSSRGIRRAQVVPKVKVYLQAEQDRYSFKVSDIEVRGGEVVGQSTGNFSKDFKSGVFQVNFDKLEVSKDIETLLLGGRFEDLAVIGQGRISDSKVDRWRGLLKFKRFFAKDFEFGPVTAKSELLGDEVAIKIKGAKGKISGGMFDFFRPSLLDHPFENEIIEVQSLSSILKVGENQITWEKTRIFLQDKISLNSNGIWTQENGIDARLFVNYPQLKQIKWVISGSKDQIKLEPDIQWLKQVAKANPRLELSDDIEKLTRLKAGEDSQSVLRGIGQKLIRRARAAMPKLLELTGRGPKAENLKEKPAQKPDSGN